MNAPDFWKQAFRRIDTPLDLLVRKRTQLREYNTPQKQLELLLEAYRVVVDFAKQKTGGHFNAEEERNLQKLLEAIGSERHIDRKLRDFADQLSEELDKPSRRFKLTTQDIISTVGPAEPAHVPSPAHSSG
jgi:hypothetical protein